MSIAVALGLVCKFPERRSIASKRLVADLSGLQQNFWPDFRLTNMPLYYVELEWNGREQGEPLWFPNLHTAEREAKEIAAEIIRQLGLRSINLSIRDQHKVIQKEIVVSD
jgi:hypothetical protein